MTRTAASDTGKEAKKAVVALVEATFWDGAQEVFVRLTNAAQDIVANIDGSDVTFTGAGELIEIGALREGGGERGQGVRVSFSGVDQSIISSILQNDFRGRRLRIWRAVLDRSTGEVDEVRLRHTGKQLGDYRVKERVPQGQDAPVAEITTSSLSPLSKLQGRNVVRATPESHNAMLARAGLPTGDTGQQYVEQIQGRIFWGTEVPDAAADGSNDNATAGTGSQPGGNDTERRRRQI